MTAVFIGLAAILLAASTGAADTVPLFDVPLMDRAPEVLPKERVVRTAAVGAHDPRLSTLSAQRMHAREVAHRRALSALHAWADAALGATRACPREAARVHRALDGAARVVGRRPLLDGNAVVLVDVPLEALRQAAPAGGLPWGP